MKSESPSATIFGDVAEVRKQHFIKLVGQLAGLRDLQYQAESAANTVELAKKIIALNLPSNLLRAAAIFVDSLYGFPAGRGSFRWPEWINATTLLPHEKRGSLVCKFLKNDDPPEESDVVVLTRDFPPDLHAGMAGIVRELPPQDDREMKYLIEFGEPDECISQKTEIPAAALRKPRPGDLIENYRL